ncbi:MAG: alpha-glucosidase/alpha-galactosidase, partial [Eubacteriales bacterium]|nr:alpha-glucosidase/alpha-galactosidase [Eubacteriales bacterium]
DLGLNLYCDEPDFGGETGAYLKWCSVISEKYRGRDILADEDTKLPERSVEYCSYIIEATALNRLFRFNGNVRNNGMITNLPYDCCAEMTMFADGSGLHRTFVGELPPQCAALNMTNISVQELAVKAALSGDPETAVQACAMDPLTSAKLTLKEIREMTAELITAEKEWLPQFKSLPRPAPDIFIPADVKRAEVPVDPALAINARFGQL